MPDLTVDQPAAEREPDHVTPCGACRGLGRNYVGDDLEYEVFECEFCSGTGLSAQHRTEPDGPTAEQIEDDRRTQALDDADDFFVIGQTSAGWGEKPDPVEVEPETGAEQDAQRPDGCVGCTYLPGPNWGARVSSSRTCPVHGDQPEPERRTVSLEVLTDELRRVEHARRLADASDNYVKPEPLDPNATVAVVLRLNGEATAVPDDDTDWHGRTRVEVFALLMEQALRRAYNDGAELLMPTPDVLAALDGRPDAQLLTAPVWVLAMDTEPGMLLAPLGSDGLRRITGTAEPCVEPECTEGTSCVVLRFDDGGEQHQSGYARTRVRIPASVTL